MMNQLRVLIYTDQEKIFNDLKALLIQYGVLASQLLWGDSSKYSRLDLINLNTNENLFFIDHDCLPSRQALQVACRLFETSIGVDSFVVAGKYENPEISTALQRAHNFVANGWLEQSYQCDEGSEFLLGGVFLVRSKNRLEARSVLFWGAEDKALSYQLREAGFQFTYCEQLKVTHHTSKSVLHFVKRAWLHGKNEVKFIKKKQGRIKLLYWLRKVDSANWNLMPLVLLHFCIQKLALLVQTIRPMNK